MCFLAWGAGACSRKEKPPPTREAVQPLLQNEAESLKREGENVNPSLGVKVTWEIRSVEVREQPGNTAQPFAGTIRFLITSVQREYDGSLATDTFEKQFDYVWDMATERWIMY